MAGTDWGGDLCGTGNRTRQPPVGERRESPRTDPRHGSPPTCVRRSRPPVGAQQASAKAVPHRDGPPAAPSRARPLSGLRRAGASVRRSARHARAPTPEVRAPLAEPEASEASAMLAPSEAPTAWLKVTPSGVGGGLSFCGTLPRRGSFGTECSRGGPRPRACGTPCGCARSVGRRWASADTYRPVHSTTERHWWG